ncbi:MAG: membrane protease subunit, stomatin/prohibitin [Deltaproteobacteria bacterium CG11_big_fil_rev_8_21_14_0_20_49_13]|nr:MAG: membrane protease subunit, stomatin/prohibitin [Deltaproteobacteria bacterium CG11_big_fil_rev_8_21_14_0_20_49_13]
MSEGIPNFNVPKNVKYIGVAAVIVLVVLFKAIVIIPAGHIGVLELFGKVRKTSLDAGIHLINPLLSSHIMSIQTKQITEDASVPSKEGLIVSLDLSALISLDPRNAPDVYKSVGADYVNVIVVPQLRSVVRGVTAGYEAKALYTAEREALATQMFDQLKPMLESRGINLERVLLRAVKLPDILSTAIEKKLEAEQQAEQMKFVLQRESQEAERKRIEAKGISDYNLEVTRGLNDNILKLRGIEATRELAKSENSKIIVVGGKDGLPLILGNQ